MTRPAASRFASTPITSDSGSSAARRAVARPTPEIQPLPEDAPLVALTEAAAGRLNALTTEEANPAIGLRVYVYSGGCSGFRYGMALDDQPTADDTLIESRGVKVYVDAMTAKYVRGSEIDYVDTLMGAGFTVNNPNAVAACG